MTHLCRVCNVEKEKTPEFFHRAGKRGLHTICKECKRADDKDARKDPAISKSEYYKSRRYRERNKEKVKEWARLSNVRSKRAAIAAYGGACACCGESAIEFLAIDHVHEDGYLHRRSGLRSGHIYNWLKKNGYPQGGRFQVLCHNCNMAKSMYGGCPHRGPPPYRSAQVRIREAAP